MRIAFVSIPRFPCAIETRRTPLLAGRPLIVGDSEQPKRVLDCSEAAARAGVRHQMTIRQALGECPEAVVVPPDPVLYRRIWQETLDALGSVTPEIEDEQLGRVYLNLSGLAQHYLDEAALCRHVLGVIQQASGLVTSIGLAAGKFPAFAAAMSVEQGELRIVRQGDEAGFLAPLPVDLLPFEAEVISRLHLFGLTAIGDVATLTVPELQSQFGFEGRRLWQLANGIDEDRLHARPQVPVLSEAFSFEAPVAGIDVMIAVAGQLLSRLRPALEGRAARELTLQAELTSNRGWERRLVFREAVSESERLSFLLRSTLQNAPPPMAIRSLTLHLSGLTGETGKQMRLGERGRLERELEEAIRQLKARYGYSPVYRCVDVEPWSAIPEARQILVESDA